MWYVKYVYLQLFTLQYDKMILLNNALNSMHKLFFLQKINVLLLASIQFQQICIPSALYAYCPIFLKLFLFLMLGIDCLKKSCFGTTCFWLYIEKKKCITMKCLCVNAFFFVAMKMFPVYSKLQNSITGNNQFSFFVYSTKNEKNMDKSCSFIYIYQYHIVLQF